MMLLLCHIKIEVQQEVQVREHKNFDKGEGSLATKRPIEMWVQVTQFGEELSEHTYMHPCAYRKITYILIKISIFDF